MTFIFWFSLGLIFYTYAGYPAVLFLLSLLFKKKIRKGFAEPRVSVILSAFNEEKTIEEKLHNLLSLDYPAEKLEVLVGSDGGFDRTDEIISKFPSSQIRFFRFVKNNGKPHVLSSLVKEAKGSVLVLTDARQKLDRQAVRALVANFQDPEVGCVSGELYFESRRHGKNETVAKGMGAYWRYEKFLRKKESQIGSMLGATGALYAIRRNLFPEQMPADILVDDMYIPLSMIQKGYRAVFESDAIAFDNPSEYVREEFKRKVRTLAGNYQIFKNFPKLLIPFKSPVAWQLFSHKLLRLVGPLSLVLLFISNLFLIARPFYAVFLTLQALFYFLAILQADLAKQGKGDKGPGYLPYIFCLLNYSAFMGLIKFLKQEPKGAWEKAYV